MPTSLPRSFQQAGFVAADQLNNGRHKRLMLSLEGPRDSGKTEFALSAPGPGMVLVLDRGIDGPLDNPNPPETRMSHFGFKVIRSPKATQLPKDGYLDYWKAFYGDFRAALDNPDCRTVIIDGDSDSWELQRLAEFGALTKIPSHLYDSVNAARRAMYARAYDSGKIIITTNKIRKVYVDKIDPATGKAELNNAGNVVRVWNGDFERQGFNDNDYLWTVQLRSLYDEEKGRWGVRVLNCKPQPSLKGYVFWGDECNFQTLVQTVYPDVPLEKWGY